MAQFLDHEAEEASSDEELEDDEGIRRKKDKPKKKKKVIDDSEDEDEDEEMDPTAAAELANFIQDEVDEPEEDAGVGDDGEKRKHEDDEFEMEDLEEEDYDLIEENLGIQINRRKRRRVRAVEDDSDDEKERKDRDAIANELFEEGDEAGTAPVRTQEDKPRTTVADEEIDEEGESDSDSFIVGDDGEPIKHRRAKADRYEDAALQEAQEIFGLDIDYADFLDQGDEEYDEDGEYEEEDEDGEIVRPQRSRKTKKSVMDVYEPSDLEHGLRTRLDNEIRMADIPERFQLRSIPVESPPEDRAAAELQDEARWIYCQMFVDENTSNQKEAEKLKKQMANPDYKEESYQNLEIPSEEQKINRIKDILDFIRNQFLEDHFIATYRKEYHMSAVNYMAVNQGQKDPSKRMKDDPYGFNAEDIREIYERDLNWMQLQKRRSNLLKLVTKMQSYLNAKRMNQPELFQDSDEISDETVDFIRNATSITELQDRFIELKLTYGQHFPNLLKMEPKKKSGAVASANGELDAALGNGDAPVAEEGDATAEAIGEDAAEVARLKRARRTDPYFICKEAGLDKFVNKFGLTVEEFIANVDSDYTVTEPDRDQPDPEILAEGFVSQRFPTANDVLNGSVFMLASSIARSAKFRAIVRKKYFEYAVVNVRATNRGIKEIDENHPCFPMKFLKNKPIKSLQDDQYIKLLQSKQEGLLEVEIGVGPNESGNDPLFASIVAFFTVDEFGKDIQSWNVYRSKAVEKALKGFLYPVFAKEVHEKLMAEAKVFVKLNIRRNLFEWINIAPYTRNVETSGEKDQWDNLWDLSNGIRVVGVAFENNWDQPGFAVATDAYGDVIESIKLPTLLNVRKKVGERVNSDDIAKLMDFILERRPHVIAVASESRRAIDVRIAIHNAIDRLRHEEKLPDIQVEVVDNRLSLLYQNSETGRAEFPNYHPIQRQAVSIARRLLDPLLAFAQLFNLDDDLLNLNIHPLQNMLSKDEFRRTLEVEFVRRVNEVGVDLNECVNHPATHGNVVQFVCGLGPRKAQRLLSLVKQTGVIVSRNQLVMVCRLGPRVFINCAGFFKINVNDLSDTVTGEQYVEPLDATRVHPETYDWARKMAVDALEYDESNEGANPSEALQEILDNDAANKKLWELDLNAFSEELERQNFGNKRITLLDIRHVLTKSFADYRPLYESAIQNASLMFQLITGENSKAYVPERLFTVTVTGFFYHRSDKSEDDLRSDSWRDDAKYVRKRKNETWYCARCRQRDFASKLEVIGHILDEPSQCPGKIAGVKVALDNGVTGVIKLQNISDKYNSEEEFFPQDRVKVGMVIHARLVGDFSAEKFYGEFTCKGSDLAKDKSVRDAFYDPAAEKTAVDKEIKKQQRRAPKINYLKRVIAHPSFKNFDYMEAESYLKTQPLGECVIRPSSKGNNKLTLSWKVAEGIHDHVEIVEQEKENVFSLGQKLVIGDETFDDLDEILARYVQPMAVFVKEIMDHKYYVDSHFGQPTTHAAQRTVIDAWLREEKSRNPARIPFCFSAFASLPRRFFLCHLPRQNVREEFVTVTPAGYIYRRQPLSSMLKLLAYFKNHFQEPPPASLNTPHGTSVTPGTGSMLITPTPSHMGVPNIAHLTSVVQNMPQHVWDKLKVAGTTAMSATPMTFATPRTPSGNANAAAVHQTPAGVTPSGSSVAGTTAWSSAAKMWQQAMTGQPSGATPATPQSVGATPASSTNWSAAAAAWVNKSNTAAPAGNAAEEGATPTTAAVSAWMAAARNRNPGDATPR
ncbi:transcription elongation factor SPT6-like [Paramacrobiotus metropolitanus]|uniref:transcription elongation factor SPT6-like n=1 Tax=Paramacrobiotus metropolitanus TaxID=2943436 RepID=UPI00244589BE|nr:transcription elongation factor SPT6-like [Paramacrobiotus metropolitanus]